MALPSVTAPSSEVKNFITFTSAAADVLAAQNEAQGVAGLGAVVSVSVDPATLAVSIKAEILGG